jgi:hypothetical protein
MDMQCRTKQLLSAFVQASREPQMLCCIIQNDWITALSAEQFAAAIASAALRCGVCDSNRSNVANHILSTVNTAAAAAAGVPASALLKVSSASACHARTRCFRPFSPTSLLLLLVLLQVCRLQHSRRRRQCLPSRVRTRCFRPVVTEQFVAAAAAGVPASALSKAPSASACPHPHKMLPTSFYRSVC